MAKKFEARPNDTYTKWSWDGGYLALNTRYYLMFMPKAKQTKLENMMKRKRATMEVTTK